MSSPKRMALLVLALLLSAPFAAATGVAEIKKEEVVDVAEGNNAFACDLYAELTATGGGNVFFSPMSIRTALAMTYAGARGETAAQMARALHFGEGGDALHAAMGSYIADLNAGAGPRTYMLAVANALWGQRGFEFLDGFLALNKEHYEAGLETLDFAGNSEGARRTINAWVEDKTNDKIKDLIPEGGVDSLTRLVLTNAIYFLGTWAEQFHRDVTKPMPFHAAPDREVEVPFMYQQEHFRYAELDGVQVLEMAYKGGRLAMTIILPGEVDGLAAVEESLDGDKLGSLIEALGHSEVKVYLPKFKIESSFSLADVLRKLGIVDAFIVDEADFSGMTLARTPDESLYISEVLHKTYVDVNEEGTEAAAATAVIMRAGAAPGPPEEPPTFRADHPFIFLIRDTHTGAVLFMGRLADPK